MSDRQSVSPNAAQIEFWNSAASRAWADQYERMDRAVADLTQALLDLAAPQPGELVLDIGCGSGTTVLELAARVEPGGHVLGADISDRHRQLVGCGQRVDWARGDGDLHHSGNGADFCPDPECLRPGGSVLGGSEVIAAEAKKIVDLIVG
jgi:SAM-dependent methyltransferase